VMLIICTILGLTLKYLKISRACVLIGFVLSTRLELIGRQFFTIYDLKELLHHPLAMALLLAALICGVYGVFYNRTKINYH